MKKIFLYLSFTLVVLPGCHKTYTCECTDGSSNIIHTENIVADNSSEAKENCSAIGIECSLQ